MVIESVCTYSSLQACFLMCSGFDRGDLSRTVRAAVSGRACPVIRGGLVSRNL